MPIYEYKCNVCDHEFEELVFSSSAENPACPECKSSDTEKLLSSFSAGASFSDPVPSMPPAGGCGSSGFG
ncbi:FmdB family zinc ribbon protein [Maridesulfovibrio sp.]|uniref:FmdB family zinc ribbon protein n=1 Tax=unclassified Maridesulfovibrio TaxID=2794999 RepID=UPI003AFFE33D